MNNRTTLDGWTAALDAYPDLTEATRAVGAYLGRCGSGDERRLWPSRDTIALMVGVSSMTVTTATRDLVAAGLLDVERTPGRYGGTTFRLTLPR